MLDKLTPVFREIQETGILAPEHIDEIEQYLPGKLTPALDLIAKNRITKLVTDRGRVFWLVEGRTGTYLVFPDFHCTCTDFLMRGVLKNNKPMVCYHILARKLAEITGHFEETNVPESSFERDILKKTLKLFR